MTTTHQIDTNPPLKDHRVFHWSATTRLAVCGQRLGAVGQKDHLGNTARGLLQVAGQYPELACRQCAELAGAR